MANQMLVIGVAGRIGSGKTTIARLLETDFGFQYLRYSLVLAEWFRTDPSCKSVLQQVGWDVMSGDRQRELNRRLIRQIDRKRDCVVDGLRHPLDLESLSSEFTSRFLFVFIETPAETRFARLSERYTTYTEFVKADSHAVESSIGTLASSADIVLNGSLPTNVLLTQIAELISARRRAKPS